MKILALDMATKTGWAISGSPVVSGVQVFDVKRGESPGMRFLRFHAWLSEVVTLAGGVKVIVFEQAHHRGGAATQACVGMVTHALSFAAKHNIETMPVHSKTLKKWATGKGNAKKEDMVKAACTFGYSPADDNEADALLLLEYACRELGVIIKKRG